MFSFHKFSLSFCLICCFNSAYAQKDLEETIQEFVLETRQIAIPGYPHAFNASIIRWKNRWLMTFRYIDDTGKPVDAPSSAWDSQSSWNSQDSSFGLVWLDEEFNPVGDPQFLAFNAPDKKEPYLLTEDPRLIVNGDTLYLVYSAIESDATDWRKFRIYVAELDNQGEGFNVVHNERLSNFEGANPDRRDKNWVPFIYDNQLLLAYHLFPHKILQPLLDGSGECKVLSNTLPSFIWEWGELRGGTPAVKINEKHYLSFFHSFIPLSTIHSDDQLRPHYFMGAYLFSATPPFEIKYISPEPIIGPNFYHGATYEPYWHPVCVVFPCGIIVDENDIKIVYGRQDHEIWIAKIDKQQLFDSLIHVSTFPSY